MTAYRVGQGKELPIQPTYSTDIERYLSSLVHDLDGVESYLNQREVAIKLLEGDHEILEDTLRQKPDIEQKLATYRKALKVDRGQSPEWVINSERIGLADKLAKQVIQQGKRRITLRDKLDDVLLHRCLVMYF